MLNALLNRTNLVLVAIAAVCFTLAACATPAETTAAIVATVGAAGAFIKELQPILTPEMQAKLAAAAGSIDGTVQATQQAVGLIADAIATFKANVGAQAAETAAAMARHAEAVAAAPSREELYLVSTGAGAAGTAAARAISAVKHGHAGKMPSARRPRAQSRP